MINKENAIMNRTILAIASVLAIALAGCVTEPPEEHVSDVQQADRVIPETRCGDMGQYANVPMTLNDGSMTNVPAGGIVPAGNGATFPVLVPAAGTLKSLSVKIAPAQHTSISGELLPYLELHKVGRDGVASTVGGVVFDPSTTVAEFNYPHFITMTFDEPILDAYYYLTFAQEWGGGQSQDGTVCGMKVAFNKAAQ